MWSGEGGSEQFAQGGGGQWFNPMMYQNVSNEDVDWASLAQQWIQMKETFPTVDQMNVLAPPPPPPPEKKEEKQEDEGEKGEAPMDMELDSKEDESKGDNMSGMNGWGGGAQWNNWQQWGWGWNAANPAAFGGAMGAFGGEGEATVAYPAVDPTSGGDMSGKGNSRTHGGFASSHQNAQFIRHPNRVWRKGDKTLRGGFKPDSRDERSESPENAVTIDAAKRKTLPAWIREGLEKMEREKQKKLIAEKEKQEKEQRDNREPVFDPSNPMKSKFDSESELSEADDVPDERVSRFRSPSHSPDKEPEAPPLQRRLSKAEILENVMVTVRKQLTQLLMRVTAEEIEKCAREVFTGYPGLKAQQQSQQRPPQSRSVKGNLGLGIYDDSGSESSESEEDDRPESGQAFESEDVLRDHLNQRKREFSRVEREIELKIQAQEEHERLAAQNEEEENEEGEEEEEDKTGQVHRPLQDDVTSSDSESDKEDAAAMAKPAEDSTPSSNKSLPSPVRMKRNKSSSRSPSHKKRKSSVDDRESEKRRDESSSRERRKVRSSSKEKKRDESGSREKRRERSYSREDSRKHSRHSESRSVSTERKRKKKKNKRDSSRSSRTESSRSRPASSRSKRDSVESSRDRYRESSRDSYRSKKRYRSTSGSSSEDRYRGSKKHKKSKKYDYDSDESEKSSRKRSRYSVSPRSRKSKSKQHKRSRSRSYSSSQKHRR